MFWLVFIFGSSVTGSPKQTQQPLSAPQYWFVHHFTVQPHCENSNDVFLPPLRLHPNKGAYRWIHTPPQPATDAQMELRKNPALRLIIAPQRAPSKRVFLSARRWIGMKCGLSSKYNIRLGGCELGDSVWCKNLMKATNLYEWLRRIMLVRRRKKLNKIKMLHFLSFVKNRKIKKRWIYASSGSGSREMINLDLCSTVPNKSVTLREPGTGRSYSACT